MYAIGLLHSPHNMIAGFNSIQNIIRSASFISLIVVEVNGCLVAAFKTKEHRSLN